MRKSRRGTFESLRAHRNYRLWVGGQLLSLTGSWLQETALPWLALTLGHSPLTVAILVACRYVPFTLFGLWAGSVVDRFDTRRALLGAQLVMFIVAVTLAAVTFTGSAALWQLYGLAFIGGIGAVVDASARQAFVYELVGPNELANAVALNSGLMSVARLAGPAVAGVIIASFGVGVCFVTNACSFTAILGALLMMRGGELFNERPAQRGRERSDVFAGLRHAWTSPELKAVLALTAAVNLVGCNFRVIVPLLARTTLGAGATAFGALFGTFGAGTVVGALAAAAYARAAPRIVLATSAGLGVMLLALAPVRSLVLCAILLFVLGLLVSVWSAAAQTLVQMAAPPAIRGRITSLYVWAFGGIAPIGAVLSGWLASVGGTSLALAVGGAGCIALTALTRHALPGGTLAPLALEPEPLVGPVAD